MQNVFLLLYLLLGCLDFFFTSMYHFFIIKNNTKRAFNVEKKYSLIETVKQSARCSGISVTNVFLAFWEGEAVGNCCLRVRARKCRCVLSNI